MGTMRSPRAAIALVVALLAIGVGAAAWLGWPDRDAPQPSDGAASPSGSAGAAPQAGDPDELAWWRLGWQPDRRTISIGTLGAGETVTLVLDAEPPMIGDGAISVVPTVVGASDGRVVVHQPALAGSSVQVVTAATGEVRELVRSADLIFDADLVGDEVAFVTVDPVDGTPLGVWLVAIDGGEPRRVDGLAAAPPSFRTVAIVPWITSLIGSRDGSSLALLRCVDVDCELRVLDQATGELRSHPMPFGQYPVFMFDGVAVMENACVAEDCDVRLLDLATGQFRDLPRAGAGPAWSALPAGGTAPLLVVTRMNNVPGGANAPAIVEIVDLSSMVARPRPVDLGTVQPVMPGSWDVGMELPDDAFLAVGGPERGDPTQLGYFLVDVFTGEVTPIPELGEPITQG